MELVKRVLQFWKGFGVLLPVRLFPSCNVCTGDCGLVTCCGDRPFAVDFFTFPRRVFMFLSRVADTPIQWSWLRKRCS